MGKNGGDLGMHATDTVCEVQREVMGMNPRTIRGTLSHDMLRVLKCATKTVAMRDRKSVV